MRVRVQAPIDADGASPDSIEAATRFLTRQMFDRANTLGVALDWSTWRTYARRRRNGDLVITQWAKVMKG